MFLVQSGSLDPNLSAGAEAKAQRAPDIYLSPELPVDNDHTVSDSQFPAPCIGSFLRAVCRCCPGAAVRVAVSGAGPVGVFVSGDGRGRERGREGGGRMWATDCLVDQITPLFSY